MPEIPYQKHTYRDSPGCHSGLDVFRPILGTMLEKDGKFSTPLYSLVDSGADWCLYPLFLLDELQIDKAKLGIDFSLGMAEGHEIYFANVTLHIMDIGTWEIDAGFTSYLNEQEACVLGHTGFFDHCKVTFDRPNLKFEVIPS